MIEVIRKYNKEFYHNVFFIKKYHVKNRRRNAIVFFQFLFLQLIVDKFDV